MSRYSPNDYPRDRRSPPPRWNGDRRASYNEAPRGRGGRELRDAPPLGGRNSYRDPRDFSPRGIRDEAPRQRRDSRDGPLNAGPPYDAPSFRGGFGRGRGDLGFRGGRGAGRGRFPDDRDLLSHERPRDRSPPFYRRDDRSPDRRDDRPYIRREEPRWADRDRERDIDRSRREPLRPDPRPLETGPPPAALVNPDRLALIEDAIESPVRRQSGALGSAMPGRRESELPVYLSARAENTSNRYGSRASSPPTQPPPVPAFTLSFAPTHNAPKAPEVKSVVPAPAVPEPAVLENSQKSPVIPTAPRAIAAEPPPTAPRAPRADSDAGPPRSHIARSRDSSTSNQPLNQPRAGAVSPTLHTTSRPGAIAVPTGPRADRTPSQPSVSPRIPFSALTRDSQAPPLTTLRSRSPPPPSAPLGPRSHGLSVSPEMSFAAAPTAPKADRASLLPSRGPDRMPPGVRTVDRNAPLGMRAPPPAAAKGPNWNQWRRDADGVVSRRDFGAEERRPRELKKDTPRAAPSQADDKMDIDPPPQPAKAPGHSAQQSFFGKPSNELEDEQELSDAVDESQSTTDDDEIEDQDLALFSAKFVRQRRELEAKLIDLSARNYRATTPLENLARLPRITMKEVERFNEREIDMDADEPPARSERFVAPAPHLSESEEGADLLTPKGEENTTVLIHDADEAEEVVRRIRRPTPELIVLPFMMKEPHTSHDKTEEYKQGPQLHEEVQHRIESGFADELNSIRRIDRSLEEEFAALYQQWREQCEEYDHEREELERMERQASFEPGPEPEQLLSASINPVLEGRRTLKFSSQYEIDQVMKESEEMARLEREKADREAKKNQADMEKEAIVPDQLSELELQQTIFIDNNTLREPESLTMVFTYEPALDDFTENEQQIFIGAFKETPKKWSEIASLLPGREPRDCIRHYYANKWDGRFRDSRSRKMKGARRGRGAKGPRSKGAAAMADLARADEGPIATSDSGRPKRAAAPTTFADRETEAKAVLAAQSPAKRAGPGAGKDGQDAEKPAKRRRAAGAQASRKAKGGQPLASLAAAPTLSPDGRPLQPPQTKESIDMSTRLEDASLLAGFSVGRPALHTEPQAMFTSLDPYMPRHLDDPNRLRAPMQAQSAKSNTSSYWSVPEQTDFNKYIKHFGTDFGAIAMHMGTKSQTMIKNHYIRQVENRPDLERDAMDANARRERGEDIGAPPVPTPIIKRKYDQPPTTASRPLMQHGDAMDIDDGIGSRPSIKQHGSPPQFSMRPQYQQSGTQADRVTTETSSTPVLATSVPTRQFQPRMSIFSDPRAEGRPSLNPTSSYMAPLATTTAHTNQSSRPVQEAQDPQYIKSLLDQQRQALRLQGQGHYSSDRVDSFQPRSSLGTLQQSPIVQTALLHGDRKAMDARPSPPPVGSFFGPKATSSSSRSGFEPPRYSAHHAVVPSPPKREDSRTSVGSGAPFSQPSQPAEPPKRSNVMSLLNDTEEPKPPKRNSMDQIPSTVVPRHGSPAQRSSVVPPPAFGGISHSYGQSSGQPQYSRSSLAAPLTVSSSLKQEPLSASSSSGIQASIPPKHEWPARPNAHGTQTPPAGPPYERGGRPPYHPYQSTMLGQLGTPNRANPSPPPLAGLQHSRTPSLSTAEPHRPHYVPGTAPGPHPSSYGQAHAPPSFGQPPTSQPPGHDHQTHSSSLAPSYPHQRASSRDERPGQYYMERDRERERERERAHMDHDWRWRQEEENERRRVDASRVPERRQYEQQDRSYQRSGPPMPPHSIHAPYSSYEQGSSRHDGGMNMREQSIREAHLAMAHEERMRSSGQFREQEQAEEARRRHDDAYMSGARRTPLDGVFGAPNLPSGRR